MSTRHTPSSFSSSVSTAKLDASCSSTTSSTSRPQRWMHFSMFCAALSAPVTMCTFASRRTPDMPIGSRMPSCPSIRNSCGSTCRIFWSAGIATAFAASITWLDIAVAHFLVADRDDAVRVQAAHVAAGDAGEHGVDLAAGHQLGFFHRALDRLHGRLDVDDHAFFQAARRMRAHAQHFDARRRARLRRPARRPSRCRCRDRRSIPGPTA